MNNVFKNLLVEKYRPQTLDDIILSDENRKYFESIKIKQEIPHLMLSGVQGIGKSSLAKILVNDVLSCQYIYINASDESSIDTIRNKVSNFAKTLSIDGKIKVIILDECDGLSNIKGSSGSSSAQQALRNIMEEYAVTTRFILTCNYPYKVIPAIHSRCQEFDLTPPLDLCAKRIVHILQSENIKLSDKNKQNLLKLIKSNYPDLRKIINNIQKHIHNNELIIPNIDNNSFVKNIYSKIITKKNKLEIRKYIIENETNFNNDYHYLLKYLFDCFYESTELNYEQKAAIMLVISNAMYQHQIVMDPEINCYACILEIYKIL